jgi:hypothetical protein
MNDNNNGSRGNDTGNSIYTTLLSALPAPLLRRRQPQHSRLLALPLETREHIIRLTTRYIPGRPVAGLALVDKSRMAVRPPASSQHQLDAKQYFRGPEFEVCLARVCRQLRAEYLSLLYRERGFVMNMMSSQSSLSCSPVGEALPQWWLTAPPFLAVAPYLKRLRILTTFLKFDRTRERNRWRENYLALRVETDSENGSERLRVEIDARIRENNCFCEVGDVVERVMEETKGGNLVVGFLRCYFGGRVMPDMMGEEVEVCGRCGKEKIFLL